MTPYYSYQSHHQEEIINNHVNDCHQRAQMTVKLYLTVVLQLIGTQQQYVLIPFLLLRIILRFLDIIILNSNNGIEQRDVCSLSASRKSTQLTQQHT
jgi:hypothetical protein